MSEEATDIEIWKTNKKMKEAVISSVHRRPWTNITVFQSLSVTFGHPHPE